MAKLLVVKEDEPGIAVTLTEVEPGTLGLAQGWRGSCTECGPAWTMHSWTEERALATAQRHIDAIHGEQS